MEMVSEMTKYCVLNLKVHMGVLKTYLSACGIGNMFGAAVGVIIYCVTTIGNNIWLSMWTDDSTLPHPEDNVTLRLSVYGALGFLLSE